MFFLLRVAFWLTIVLALLPSGTLQPGAQANNVGATDAMVAAGAAVSDMTGFCERQPDACEVGVQAATAIGYRAQAGAKMVYDFFSEHGLRGEPASATQPKLASARPAAAPRSQNTLKGADLDPAWQAPAGWQAPGAQTDVLPMPRKDPRRKA